MIAPFDPLQFRSGDSQKMSTGDRLGNSCKKVPPEFFSSIFQEIRKLFFMEAALEYLQ